MDKDRRYRSRKKLRLVVKHWKQLDQANRTEKILYAMTDAAGLDREFVQSELEIALVGFELQAKREPAKAGAS